YAASEKPIEGVEAKSICDKIKQYSPGKNAEFLPKEKLVEHLLKIMEPGDLIITLGAGDITKISDELVERIKGQGQLKRAA
ncbi:MAG: UDP-N-acetylmuramate--L-alanine ligase, partial [Candidatus Omnitrophica bacterium]|nr:UDP-N-acetylmuramate--L-alanine ligase [Candidatus Omnitrophota bacterium]